MHNHDLADVIAAARLLDVENATTVEEIKKGYRKACIKYHPDRSKEANADEKFKMASEAFNILVEYSGTGGTLPVTKLKLDDNKSSRTKGKQNSQENNFVRKELRKILKDMSVDEVFQLFDGDTSSILASLYKQSKISVESLDSIAETLIDAGLHSVKPETLLDRIQKGAKSIHSIFTKPFSKPERGIIRVTPRTFEQYKKLSNNGKREFPLYCDLIEPSGKFETATFHVKLASQDVAIVNGRRYNIQIQKPDR